MKTSAKRLFLFGGKANKCVAHFVELAGGADSHVVILSHASGIPRQVGNELQQELNALGVKKVTIITPRSPQLLPADADAIYMTGGDQLRLVRLLHRGGLYSQVKAAYDRGVLIAGGTSAGAAAAAQRMVAGGMVDSVLRPGSLRLAEGLGLLLGVVIDTHFAERNRFNRMRAAVATLTDTVAVGLDEDSAVLIVNGRCTVYGKGKAHFFRRKASDEGTIVGDDRWMRVASDVVIRSFGAGSNFRLARRNRRGTQVSRNNSRGNAARRRLQ